MVPVAIRGVVRPRSFQFGLSPMLLWLCLQYEFPVKGHGSTPFAVATAVMLQRSPGAASSSALEPVLLVAALADIGVTGV